MSHVAEAATIFLSTLTMPHVLVCMQEDFAIRWCRYIHWGCCGGRGYGLPDGLWVTSSGCGGVLSWFDDAGHILFRSPPHPGGGLAIAYGNRITVLADGLALVEGAPGLMAYDHGELVWRMNSDIFSYAVSERDELLLVSRWRNSPQRRSSVTLEAYRLPAALPSSRR